MKSFGHTRPVRNSQGDIVGSKLSPVKVRTVGKLSAFFGPDRDKRLVVTCHPMDTIGIRPERTTREVHITVTDLYAYVLRMVANHAHLEKARERKAKKAARLARLRQARAEKRLFAK